MKGSRRRGRNFGETYSVENLQTIMTQPGIPKFSSNIFKKMKHLARESAGNPLRCSKLQEFHFTSFAEFPLFPTLSKKASYRFNKTKRESNLKMRRLTLITLSRTKK